MKKNDFLAIIENMKTETSTKLDNAVQVHNNAMDIDKEHTKKDVQKWTTKLKYLSSLGSVGIFENVAAIYTTHKFSEQTLRDIAEDSYSLSKLSQLAQMLAASSKTGKEHSFNEFIFNAIVNYDDFSKLIPHNEICRKMKNKKGDCYGTRQAQMSAVLFERLNVAERKKDQNGKAATLFNTESGLIKKLVALYA